MSKKIFFLIALLNASIYCTAQETRELNWQDFTNSVKTTLIAQPVKTGEFTIFQIKDINKFLYKVEIAGKVFELQTPIPTELQTLFRLTPQQLAKRDNSNTIQEGADLTEKQGKAMEQLKEGLGKIEAKTPKQAALLSKMETLINVCQEYYSKASKLANDVFELKAVRNKLILVAQSDKSHNAILGMLNDVVLPNTDEIKNNFSQLHERQYNSVEAQYKEAQKQAEAVKKEADENLRTANISTVGKVGPALINAQAAEAIAKTAVDASIADLEKIKNASDGVEKADQLISDEALLSLIDEVDFLYKELGNKNNFIVLSPPVQMDGDLISYTVNITPCVTRTLGPNRSPMQFKFDIPAKKGLKVDFGVGPALSFGDNSRDDKYFLANVDADGRTLNTDTVRLTKLKNNNVISPGIVAMMHIYARSGKWVSWGGSFGVGAGFQATSDVNLSIYSGLCLVMGKREKVMLSSGVSWLKIERRKEDRYLAIGDRFKASDINLAEASEKVFKPSFFIGITYNLTNKVEMK